MKAASLPVYQQQLRKNNFLAQHKWVKDGKMEGRKIEKRKYKASKSTSMGKQEKQATTTVATWVPTIEAAGPSKVATFLALSLRPELPALPISITIICAPIRSPSDAQSSPAHVSWQSFSGILPLLPRLPPDWLASSWLSTASSSRHFLYWPASIDR